MSSAIKTPAFAAKAGNIQNEDNSSIYSGGEWSFKNASAVTGFHIASDGKVGIGTTSPDHILVLNHATDTRIRFENAGTAIGQLQAINNEMRLHALSTNILGLWTQGGERMRIDASGNLTVSPLGTTGNFTVQTGGYSGQVKVCTGAIMRTSTVVPDLNNVSNLGSSSNRWATVYSVNALNTSDQRLKQNIEDMKPVLDKVLSLKPRTWESKYESYPVGSAGFIADEIETVFPHMIVTEDKETIEGHDNVKQIQTSGKEWEAILVKAIQEQQAMIEELKAKVSALESK